MNNKNYNSIETILYSYTHYKDEIERLDKEIANISIYNLKVLELKRSKLREVERIVEFVEKSIDILDEDEKRIIEFKYFRRKNVKSNRIINIIKKINDMVVA